MARKNLLVLMVLWMAAWDPGLRAAPFAYVADAGIPGRVRIVNTATQTLLAEHVAVENLPAGVAVTPAADLVVVTNKHRSGSLFGPGSLSVITASDHRVRNSIPLGDAPNGVAVNPSGTRAVVGLGTVLSSARSVAVVDLARGVVVHEISLGNSAPEGVVLSPDGQFAYIATNDGLKVIGVASGAILTHLNFPRREDAGSGIAVSPDGRWVYLVSQVASEPGRVFAISTSTWTFGANAPLQLFPSGIVVAPDGSRLYVSNSGSNTVSVVDAKSLQLLANIPVAGVPVGVSITPDGRFVYVTSSGEDKLSIIDTATSTVVKMLEGAGGTPYGIGIASGKTTVPTLVEEYYNPARDHYFMTADATEILDLHAGVHTGWTRTGERFLAYATGGSNGQANPVCRFYGLPAAGLDSHFYSADTSECLTVSRPPFYPSWVKESDNVFEIPLPNTLTGDCPAGTLPVYRLWNRRADSNHRYVTNPALKQQLVSQGYAAEGYGPDAVALCALEL